MSSINLSKNCFQLAVSFRRLFTFFHHLHKFIEQIAAVPGTGRIFGMILNGEDGQVFVAQPFYRTIIQINMGDFQLFGQTIGIDRVAVVLGGDMSASGGQFFHRMIAAAVAEFQFEGLSAEGMGDQLVAQADAHDGFFAGQSAHGIDGIIQQGRDLPGPGESRIPSGFSLRYFRSAGGTGHNGDRTAPLASCRRILYFSPQSKATILYSGVFAFERLNSAR